jgi:hypothetical protein
MAQLAAYKIQLKQILPVTVDNGANMFKMGSNLKSRQQNILLIDFRDEQRENYENRLDSDENADETNDVDVDLSQSDDESDKIMKTMHEMTGFLSVQRCAAHTIQLSVIDVTKELCKDENFKLRLSHIRSVVKSIKSSSYVEFVRREKMALPKLDCVTRWMSTFLMMQSLQNIKSQMTNIYVQLESSNLLPAILLSDEDWENVATYLDAFRPIFIFTKKLQTEQLDISNSFINCISIDYKTLIFFSFS